MKNIDPGDLGDNDFYPIEAPNWLKKNWSQWLMLLAGLLIGIGIGIMLLKGRCESIVEYYELLNSTCLLR